MLGWVDHFKTWSRDLEKRVEAGQDVTRRPTDRGGIGREALHIRAAQIDATWLATLCRSTAAGGEEARQHALSPELAMLMSVYAASGISSPPMKKNLEVVVDRERARFGAWYELFPRSCSTEPGQHGTFKDVEKRACHMWLRWVSMCSTCRQSTRSEPASEKDGIIPRRLQPGDPGSPWAIGSAEGGHKAIHPELGTLEDFHHLIQLPRNMESSWRSISLFNAHLIIHM